MDEGVGTCIVNTEEEGIVVVVDDVIDAIVHGVDWVVGLGEW